MASSLELFEIQNGVNVKPNDKITVQFTGSDSDLRYYYACMKIGYTLGNSTELLDVTEQKGNVSTKGSVLTMKASITVPDVSEETVLNLYGKKSTTSSSTSYAENPVKVTLTTSSTLLGTFNIVPDNYAPSISGSDMDLGVKNSPIIQTFTVDDKDKDDSITVTIKINDTTIDSFVATRNKVYTIDTTNNWVNVPLGKNTLSIIASDGKRESIRKYTFEKTNSTPTISGEDSSLGEKYKSFSIEFSVNDLDVDDTLLVTTKINSYQLSQFNAEKQKKYTIDLKDVFNELDYGQHNITISVNDGTVTTTRTYTFIKVIPPNNAPTITGSDRDLGSIYEPLHHTYAVNDTDTNDTLTVLENIDGELFRTIQDAIRNKEYYLDLSSVWDEIKLGFHAVSIIVSDGQTQSIRNYTFTKVKPPNKPPVVSYEDIDLGERGKPFSQTYFVDDVDKEDILHVEEKLDGRILKSIENAVRKEKYTIDLSNIWNELSLGNHRLSVVVSDDTGGSAVRNYDFIKTDIINNPPKISGMDGNLGKKNSAFDVNFTVQDSDSDILNAVIKLNDNIIKMINNVVKNKEYSVSIDKNIMKSLVADKENVISINVTDGMANVVRYYTFTKINNAPIISGVDGDLGNKSEAFTHTFSFEDIDVDDTVTLTTMIDNEVIDRIDKAIEGKDYSIDLELYWNQLTLGRHTISIIAIDDEGNKSSRFYTFTKIASIQEELDGIYHLEPEDIDLKENERVRITCKQLDDIVLHLNVYDYGKAVNLSGYTIQLRVKKPDDSVIIQSDNIAVENNHLVIKCKSGTTSVAGQVKGEIVLFNNSLRQKSSFDIIFDVKESVITTGGQLPNVVITEIERLGEVLQEATIVANKLEEVRELNKNLKTNISNANVSIIQLERVTETGNNLNVTLLNTIETGENVDIALQGTVQTAFDNKNILDSANELAKKNITALQSLGDVTELAQKVESNSNSISDLQNKLENLEVISIEELEAMFNA